MPGGKAGREWGTRACPPRWATCVKSMEATKDLEDVPSQSLPVEAVQRLKGYAVHLLQAAGSEKQPLASLPGQSHKERSWQGRARLWSPIPAPSNRVGSRTDMAPRHLLLHPLEDHEDRVKGVVVQRLDDALECHHIGCKPMRGSSASGGGHHCSHKLPHAMQGPPCPLFNRRLHARELCTQRNRGRGGCRW